MRVTSLKEVFKIIHEHIKAGEISFRFDGDEGRSLFVTVEKNTPYENIYAIMAYIYDQRRSFMFSFKGPELPTIYYSVSTGIFVPDYDYQGVAHDLRLVFFVSGWNRLSDDELSLLVKEADSIRNEVVETQEFMLSKLEQALRSFVTEEYALQRARQNVADSCSRVNVLNRQAVGRLLMKDSDDKIPYSLPEAELLARSIYLYHADKYALRCIAIGMIEMFVKPQGRSFADIDTFGQRLCSHAKSIIFPRYDEKKHAIMRVLQERPLMGINMPSGEPSGYSVVSFSPLEIAYFLENSAFLDVAPGDTKGGRIFAAALGAYDAVMSALAWFHALDKKTTMQYFRHLRCVLMCQPQSRTVDVYFSGGALDPNSEQKCEVKVSHLISACDKAIFETNANQTNNEVSPSVILRTAGIPAWSRYPEDIKNGRTVSDYHHVSRYSDTTIKGTRLSVFNITRIEHKGNVVFDYSSLIDN